MKSSRIGPTPAQCFAYALAVIVVSHATTPTTAMSVPPELFAVADPGLEVKLWATSPLLRNPTNLDFDSEGRVWVAEGVNYRQHYDRQPAGDRIVVLEDSDGDGKADRTSVFVQEPFLRAPMGLAVIGNRVVVSMAPDLIVYTDVNGDRKFDPAIDQRTVILTGFNGRRHDHSLHSVTVGPDGLWYFNAGNCGAVVTDKSGRTFRFGSPFDPTDGQGGKSELGWDPQEIAGQTSDDGHVYVGGFAARMNPDGTGLSIIGHNFRNSYEQAVTALGDVFHSDNDDLTACRTSFLMEYGNAGFSSADGQRAWAADRRPGQSVPTAEWRQEDPGVMPAGDVYGGGSPAGIAFVEGSALGKQYQGLLLSCEPGRNAVFGYFPRPSGAGFQLEHFNFLTSNRNGEFAGTDFTGGDRSVSSDLKTHFRPSDVGVGPDGAIYVADFFDPRVGGHTDQDDSLSGSIYRIAPKGFKGRAPKLNLKSLSGALEGLKSPAVNVRGAAFYAVKSHGPKAIKALTPWLKDADPVLRARAIWLLAQLGPEGVALVEPFLQHPEPPMRLTALRALRQQNHDVVRICGTLATDPSPAVRREVALALRDLPFEDVKNILLTLARGFDGLDRTYLEALGTGCTRKESEFYDYAKPVLGDANPLRWSTSFARLAWRLHPPQSVPDFRVRALLASIDVPLRRAALTAIAQNATADAADALLDVAAQAADWENHAVHADAVWWLLNRKDTLWKEHHVAEKLKQRGVYDPAAVVLRSVTVPEPEPIHYPPITEVSRLRGSAARGAGKVNVCLTCHRIGNVGTEYAPNLTGWVQRQTTEAFLLSVIDPSADIAHGYAGTVITTPDGLEIHGRVLSAGDPLIVQSTAGLSQMIPAQRIASRQPLNRSLMPNAEQLGLQPQDLMDIHAFLKTR